MSKWLEWVKALRWPIGADCWYWATWVTDGGAWQQGVLLGADQKDGYPIFDVLLPDAGGVVVWGWVWQVGLGAQPTDRPPALDGAAGPWP